MMDGDIDFVVTWVDDSDPEWRADRRRFQAHGQHSGEGASDVRFRDWGALRYWFRGILQFCPWVRKIHLVTTNPTPAWFVRDTDRVTVVSHDQIIDPQYLPTFNSRAIELNLHKIPDLAEKFVYFNDDMYVLRELAPAHFFPGGKPAGIAIQTALSVGDNISHAMLNNINLINNTFRKSEVLKHNRSGWFNAVYGRQGLQNIALAPWKRFTGFHNHHLPICLTKSTCERVWELYAESIHITMGSKFRQFHDVNVFLFYYLQLCEGDFTPVSPSKYGHYEQLSESNTGEVAAAVIKAGSVPMLCLNDGAVPDYDTTSHLIESAMQELLPDASCVERSGAV